MQKHACIDDYIAAQPEPAQRVLTRVRAAIRKALPGAEEVISYGIPAYRLHGRVVIYFAGWQRHYAVYPATARVAAAFERQLSGYERGKGTIRFPPSGRVPVALIAGIAKVRAQEVAERQLGMAARRRDARAVGGGASSRPGRRRRA
jgi:uncharacterized protein YdhG (YjbR/CyaY superfamily)